MTITKELIDCIEQKKLIWYGHVQRMSGERLPIKVINEVHRKQKKKVKKSWIGGKNNKINESKSPVR